MKAFKISLTAARVNSGLSLWELANRINVSAATLEKWETGKSDPTLAQLQRISRTTGVPIDYIYLPEKPPQASRF